MIEWSSTSWLCDKFGSEESLMQACKSEQEGKYRENLYEVARLRELCIKNGINPEE